MRFLSRKADFGLKDDSLGSRLWGGVCEMKAAWSCGIRSVPFLMLAQMALVFLWNLVRSAARAKGRFVRSDVGSKDCAAYSMK